MTEKTRKRTASRELAVQLLYQHELRTSVGAPPGEDEVERFLADSTDDDAVEIRDFSRRLYLGALESIETADRLISEVADNWKLERIAAIDRAVLRLAIFELNELPEVPSKVVINEAIDLAKKFSTAQSGAFVNGILDRLLVLRDDTSESTGDDAPV